MSKNETLSDKKEFTYNTTVTAFFESGAGNLVTRKLDQGALEEIKAGVAKLKVGDILFIKKSKYPNKAGKFTRFMEIADPSTFGPRRDAEQSADSDDV